MKLRTRTRPGGLTQITLAAGLLSVAVLGALSACGGNGGSETPAPTPSPSTVATPSPTRTPSGPPATPATTDVPITLEEYVIKPGVTRAPFGTIVFKVKNAGQVEHQFIVVRSDLPIAELPRRPQNQGVDEKQIDIVGRIDSIAPGAEAELSLELDPGQYVLIDNLFVDGRSYYLSGMYNQLVIQGGQ